MYLREPKQTDIYIYVLVEMTSIQTTISYILGFSKRQKTRDDTESKTENILQQTGGFDNTRIHIVLKVELT